MDINFEPQGSLHNEGVLLSDRSSDNRSSDNIPEVDEMKDIPMM